METMKLTDQQTIAAKRRLADDRLNPAVCHGGVRATTPHTSVIDQGENEGI